jgi:hypothetical protein
VFDASCKVNGPSLNECLYSGPNLLARIFDILIRFRLNRIEILADIKQAFLKIPISSEHRNYLQTHLLDELAYHFDVIGVTETRIKQDAFIDFNPSMPNYNFEFVHTPFAAGGVGMYIDSSLKYKILERSSNESYQALWIEIQ